MITSIHGNLKRVMWFKGFFVRSSLDEQTFLRGKNVTFLNILEVISV